MAEPVTNQIDEEVVDQTEGATVDQISFQDLQNVVQIINVATERGAFRAPEMSQVGAVYDKISGFVEYVVAQQQAQAEAQEETQGES